MLTQRWEIHGDAEAPMFDAVWTASFRSLNTRREVRGFLARGKAT